MPDRREFLRAATRGGGVFLALGAGSCLSRAADARGGASSSASFQAGFRGAAAGEQRRVDAIPVCWCPPGRFMMGSPPDERGRRADEAQVDVVLTRGFWMGTFEVTQGQWRGIAGDLPGRGAAAEFGIGDDHPVYWLTYHDAQDFCARLTTRARASGSLPEGWAFGLPTEAQWEYACRAGTRTATSFGDELTLEQANFGRERPDIARSRGAPTGSRPAGSYPANAWGIRDMHGNVWEWCRDWYHARLPGGTDPDLSTIEGVQNGDGTFSRVRRGGAWIEEEWACRSACRLRYEPHRGSDHIGFRVGVFEV